MNTSSGVGVSGSGATGYGILGTSKSNAGVVGMTMVNATTPSTGKSGIAGYDKSTNKNTFNSGTYGVSVYSNGVQGRSTYGPGVLALSSKAEALVATVGTALFSGFTNVGVVAQSSSGTGIIGVGDTSGIVGFATTGCQAPCFKAEIPSGGAVTAATDSGGIGVVIRTDTGNSGEEAGVGETISSGTVGLEIDPDVTSDGTPGLIINGTMSPRDPSGGAQGAIISGQNGVSITSDLTGLAVTGGRNGIPVIVSRANGSSGVVFAGQSMSGDTTSTMDDSGNLTLAGTVTQHAATKDVLPSADGTRRISYGALTSSPTLDDMGEQNLRQGAAYVRLDEPLRAAMDSLANYLVFLTPQGETNGLYVSDKTSRGFWVHEIAEGRSSLAFDYRIVVRPFGHHGTRLATEVPVAKTAFNQRLFYKNLKPLRFVSGKLDRSSLPKPSF